MTTYNIKQSGDGVRVTGSVDWSPEDRNNRTSDAEDERLLCEVKATTLLIERRFTTTDGFVSLIGWLTVCVSDTRIVFARLVSYLSPGSLIWAIPVYRCVFGETRTSGVLEAVGDSATGSLRCGTGLV